MALCEPAFFVFLEGHLKLLPSAFDEQFRPSVTVTQADRPVEPESTAHCGFNFRCESTEMSYNVLLSNMRGEG